MISVSICVAFGSLHPLTNFLNDRFKETVSAEWTKIESQKQHKWGHSGSRKLSPRRHWGFLRSSPRWRGLEDCKNLLERPLHRQQHTWETLCEKWLRRLPWMASASPLVLWATLSAWSSSEGKPFSMKPPSTVKDQAIQLKEEGNKLFS